MHITTLPLKAGTEKTYFTSVRKLISLEYFHFHNTCFSNQQSEPCSHRNKSLTHTSPSELTRLFEDGAPLVAGRPETGSTDIIEACLVNTSVKDMEHRLLLLPLRHDLVVDEGGKHLCLDEVRQKGKVGLWLV